VGDHPAFAHALPDLIGSAIARIKTAARHVAGTAVYFSMSRLPAGGSLGSQILHVNVGAEPDVVSQIPSDMIGVVVDDDLIRIPQPVAAEAKVVRRYAKVEAAKPESARSASRKAPNVAAANAAGKAAVFPRVVEMVMSIVATGVMPHPMVALRVDVRSVWVAGFL
jgi:hypothetical protein